MWEVQLSFYFGKDKVEVLDSLKAVFTDLNGIVCHTGYQSFLKKVRAISVDGASPMGKVAAFLTKDMPALKIHWRDRAHAVRTCLRKGISTCRLRCRNLDRG